MHMHTHTYTHMGTNKHIIIRTFTLTDAHAHTITRTGTRAHAHGQTHECTLARDSHRLEVGLQKLLSTAAQVEVMQRELKGLQPILARTSQEVEDMMVVITNDKKEAGTCVRVDVHASPCLYARVCVCE